MDYVARAANTEKVLRLRKIRKKEREIEAFFQFLRTVKVDRVSMKDSGRC